jgi:DNA-binding HxlR family transcriptional regulator
MENTDQSQRLLLDQVADKWTILILTVLCNGGGSARFNAMKRQVEGISQKALTQCLRRLERNGLINRALLDTAPLGVEYSLTPLGRSLEGPFKVLNEWAEIHLPEVTAAQQAFDSRNERRFQVVVAPQDSASNSL